MQASARRRAGIAGLALALAFLGFVPGGNAPAQSAPQYTRLTPARPVATGERIEVLEFFHYGCPVCYELQPHLTRWLAGAPGDVAIRRVPAVSSQAWEPLARLYYALEALDQVARLHWPVYDNLHFDGVPLNDEQTMLDWVSRNGVDGERFLAVYRSPEVGARVEEARQLLKGYEVRGVPTLVVDGRFLSSARMAGGTRELMQVVDQLVRQARKDRANQGRLR